MEAEKGGGGVQRWQSAGQVGAGTRGAGETSFQSRVEGWSKQVLRRETRRATYHIRPFLQMRVC